MAGEFGRLYPTLGNDKFDAIDKDSIKGVDKETIEGVDAAAKCQVEPSIGQVETRVDKSRALRRLYPTLRNVKINAIDKETIKGDDACINVRSCRGYTHPSSLLSKT